MTGLTRTALIALMAALMLLGASGSAGAAKGPAAAGTVYGGYTAQDTPIVVTLDRNRAAIKTVGLFISSPDYYTFGDTGRAVAMKPSLLPMGDHVVWGTRIARNGSFKASGLALKTYGDNLLGLFTYTLSGKVKRGVMQGTVRATLALTDPATGQSVETVTFGTVRWMAVSAPGRVFAGMTTDRDPVVVELDGARRQARFVRIPWRASSDTSAWAISETLRSLKLAGGTYSRAWSEPYTRSDGGRNTFDYRFALRVTRSKASGTIQVKVTETDAAGAVEGACDSGVVSFKATSSSGKTTKGRTRNLRLLKATSSSAKAAKAAPGLRVLR